MSGSLRARGLVSLAALAALAGCGQSRGLVPEVPTYPVSGKVTLPSGSPLTSGTVVLEPTTTGSIQARGPLQSDGTFTLKVGAREGAPAGDFKVRIEPDGSDQPPPKPGTKQPLYASRFTDAASSGLTATIKPEGTNDLAFQLR